MASTTKIVFAIILISFLLLFILLSNFSRLASDDFFFIWDVCTNGLAESIKSQYLGWSGRYSATLIPNIFYQQFQLHQQWYCTLPLLSFTFLFFGLYTSFHFFFEILAFTVLITTKIFLSVFFIALLFFASPDIGESWFWYDGLSSYLWSLIAICWIPYLLFKSSKNKIYYPFLFFCVIYAASASEVYALFYFIIAVIILSYTIYFKKNRIFFFHRKSIIIISSLFILFSIAFSISVFAPGNFARASQFPDSNLKSNIYFFTRMVLKWFFYFLPQKIPYFITFLFYFLFIGIQLKENTNAQKFFNKKIFVSLVLFFAISLLIVFGSIAVIMSQSGEYRIWLLVSFMFVIVCIYSALWLGMHSGDWIKKIKLLFYCSSIFFFVVCSFQIQKAYQYSKAVDERTEKIIRAKENGYSSNILYLDPLPESGFLYSAEISIDTLATPNKAMKLAYDLPFNISLKSK